MDWGGIVDGELIDCRWEIDLLFFAKESVNRYV